MRQRNDHGYPVFSHDVGRVIGDGEKFEHPDRVTGCTQLYAEDSEVPDAGRDAGSGEEGDDGDQGQQSDDGQEDDDPAVANPPKASRRRRGAGQDGDAS
jgi:hypothetical protein